jgi:predicted kinase
MARLIVIAGPPCSGKSTLGAALARRYGIPHLSMDATRQRILPHAAHTRADREAAYRAMHFAAELLLLAGAGVLLDAPYGHPEDRADLRSIIAASSADCKLVECRISPAMAVARFRERGSDAARPDLSEEVVARAAREYDYTSQGLALDVGRITADECLRRAAAWLDAD